MSIQDAELYTTLINKHRLYLISAIETHLYKLRDEVKYQSELKNKQLWIDNMFEKSLDNIVNSIEHYII